MAKMQRTDEELLTELEQTISAASASATPGEAKNRRVRALEQLERTTLTDKTGVVEALCDVPGKLGLIEPESRLVTKCLAKLANADAQALAAFIRLVEEHHQGAVQCGCRVLPSMRGSPEVRLASSLAKELTHRDTRDSVTEILVGALKQLKHGGAKRAVAEELARSLDSPDSLKILHAVTILVQIADESVERGMVKVLRKLLDGYYQDHAQAIRQDLCRYFVRVKSKKAVPGLLRGIELDWDICFAEALGTICDYRPEVQADILRLFKKASGVPARVGIRLHCLSALSRMQREKPRVGSLANMIDFGDLRYDSFRGDLKRVLLRNPRESKPILLGMLQGESEEQYQFAMDVLKEMDVPMEEVAKATGVNVIVAIYNYFFEDRTNSLALRALWEAKAKLGNGVGGTTTRFEHLLRHLLSCLGFITLDVDPSRRAGVDTIAFPPTWSHVLLIGSTTSVVGDKLEKLADTLRGVRKALGELARKIQILPIVATSMAGETNPKDEEYARRHGILVLRQSDVDRLVEWVSANRTYKKLLAYLDGKVGTGRRKSVWEALQSSVRRA